MKKTNRILSVILALVMIISIIPMSSITASATSGFCGTSLHWSFDSSTGTLTIFGSGEMTNYGSSSMPWFKYRANIKTVIIKSGATWISSNAFYNYDSLTSVTIPDTVTSIENQTFRYCPKLEKITVSSSNAFYFSDEYGVLFNKEQTKLIQYPRGNDRTNYIIPDTVTSIADGAFRECTYLKRITVGSNNQNYSSDNKYGVLFNKDKTTLIMLFPANTTTSYTVPDTVISISSYAFEECKNLESITIPDSVTTIGFGAFYSCTNLTSVTIGNGIEKIYSSAFGNCSKINEVNISDALAWCSICFYGNSSNPLYYAKTLKINGEIVTDLIIPDGATLIGENTFINCNSLTSIVIPDSVTTIESYAFDGCSSLTTVTIGDSLETIYKYAFNNCTSLTTITIPKSVTVIEDYAFNTCKNLTDVYYTGTEDEWYSILVYPYNDPLYDANLTFNYHAHDYVKTVTAPTCTEQGYTTYTCECGNSYVDDYVDSTGHNYTSKITTPATHLTTGVETFTCDCGDSYTEIIDKIEKHNYESIVTAPTCTEQGYTTYTCECGDTYVDDYVDATGHNYTSKITTLATHLATGVETFTCTCGDSYTEVIEKVAEHKHEALVTAPTCTEQGYTTYTCECGDTHVDDYVDATGHNYSSEITTPATHTKTGVMTYTCDCGDTYTETIEKIEKHNYESVVTEPTCTEQGYTTYTCECGDSYVDDYVGALGHTEEIIPAVAPSCTETGLIEGAKCSVCGEILTEQKELPANGHTPANAVEENYVAPTCTENGSKDVVVYCSVCDEEISRETVTLEATGHDAGVDGNCNICNEHLCEHSCHKGGISGFFWKITLFFNKLFGSNKYCSCGVAHY